MNTKKDTKGRIKKGQRLSIATEFQKGHGFWTGKKRPNMTGSNNPKWKGGAIKRICKCCGKTFLIKTNEGIKRRNSRKFCSVICSSKLRKGKNNVNWKGGISEGKDKYKNSELYKEWRRRVFKRDKWTCRKCGHRSKMSKAHGDKRCDIEAHHIIPLREDVKLSLKIGNGITLCEKCHKLTYGKELYFSKVFKEILNDYTHNNPKG